MQTARKLIITTTRLAEGQGITFQVARGSTLSPHGEKPPELVLNGWIGRRRFFDRRGNADCRRSVRSSGPALRKGTGLTDCQTDYA
jgi:hypothetical protein